MASFWTVHCAGRPSLWTHSERSLPPNSTMASDGGGPGSTTLVCGPTRSWAAASIRVKAERQMASILFMLPMARGMLLHSDYGMRVRFWGTRGSLATPGPGTVHYGGNTSCVELTTFGGQRFIIDCGTGARLLGADWMVRGRRDSATILLR